ncbi:MAG: flagellin [Butyrivibrio sp.]|nr:flagellin [Butyrivibrio sp.]
MAMVVQHNITAMNSNRQLGVTTSGQAKSSEKLSSGYKINRAGDDAAGLKISEKMRSQVRGLNRASDNAQDGISLIQTAEGALNEAHSILQRMNELAVQGANDTNENIDRDAINEELSALTAELDRISQTTQFNKQNLLDGGFTDKNLQVGANANQKIAISIDNMNAQSLGLRSVVHMTEDKVQTGMEIKSYSYNGMTKSYIATNDQLTNLSAINAQFQGSVAQIYADNSLYAQQVDTTTGSAFYTMRDTKEIPDGLATGGTVLQTGRYSTAASARAAEISCQQAAISNVVMDKTNFTKYITTDTDIAKPTSATSATGIVAVDNYTTANNSITAIQEAINKVSTQRSALGAIQNRLEHTVANLDNVSENTAAAESRIRDTDMADEMVEYSKNNILAQAGQSMLAQANQSTQGVLSLLG